MREQAVEEGAHVISASEDHQSDESVRKLFESAKSRIARLIEVDGPLDIRVELGQQGAAVSVSEHNRAVDEQCSAIDELAPLGNAWQPESRREVDDGAPVLTTLVETG